MVIHNVVFEGTLQNSCLTVKVDENYCAIRIGKWRFKIDSIAATVLKATHATAVIGCSLLTSQQKQDNKVVLSNTPLHVITISKNLVPVKAQIISPGQIVEWQYFNAGSQKFQLTFSEVGPRVPLGAEGLALDGLFVAGIIMFEYCY